jgi:hypothetical protein
MNCEEVRKYISLFDEINESDLNDRFLDHINQCNDCKKTYGNINSYKEVIQSFSEREVPQGFERKVLEKLKKEKIPKIDSKGFFQFGYGLIAASLVIIMFFLYLPNEKSEKNFYDINFALKMEKKGKGPADLISYDIMDAKINDLVNQSNGIIESTQANNVTGYYDNMIISVPANSASEFLNTLKTISALELDLPDQLPKADLYRFKIHFDMINFTSANITGDKKDELVIQFISGANKGKWVAYERTHSTYNKWSELKVKEKDSTLLANYNMESGDFDGDGYDDLLLYEFNSFNGLTFRILMNNGNLELIETKPFSYNVPSKYEFVSIKPYDVNNDSKDDLLWLSIDDSNYIHFDGMNISTDYNPIKIHKVGGRLPFIFPSNFTSDQNMDVVLKQTWSGESTIYIGKEEGNFNDIWQFYRSFSGDYIIWSGDYNGDGLEDLFVKDGGPFIPGTFYLIVSKDEGLFEGAPRFKLNYPDL